MQLTMAEGGEEEIRPMEQDISLIMSEESNVQQRTDVPMNWNEYYEEFQKVLNKQSVDLLTFIEKTGMCIV